MTEVDYSPEAYQRYMATRARVGNWAVEASSYASQYTHPFQSHQPSYSPTAFGPVPEVRPSDSISLYNAPRGEDRARGRERERSRTQDYDRPSHSRSKSTPHASTSYPTTSRHAPQPTPVYVDRQPARTRTEPAYKTIDLRKYPEYIRNGEVKLPPLRPGETYMLIPPKGKRVEVLTTSSGGSHTYRLHSAATSPTRHPPQHTRYVSQPQNASPYMSSSRAARATSPPPPIAYASQGGYGYVQQQVYAPHKVYQSPPVPIPRAKSPVKKPLLKRLLTGAGDKPRSGR